jgi:hypothetical protein
MIRPASQSFVGCLGSCDGAVATHGHEGTEQWLTRFDSIQTG